jgi:uncharacterized protein
MKRERTKPISGNGKGDVGDVHKKYPVLGLYSQLTSRVALASQMGFQYRGERDIYRALGYPLQTTLKYSDYKSRYVRQDIAKAIIDRPVKASWKGEVNIIENISKEETPFEKQWKELAESLKLKSIFIRADKLTGIGQFGIILLGLSDIVTNDGFKTEVRKRNGLKLLYVKPIGQDNVTITKFDENVRSKRYGLPVMYKVSTKLRMNDSTYKDVNLDVHYTRIVHLVEDVLEDEVKGTPRLEVVFNRLMDLDKLIGGDAEMFWRGARPGYTGKLDPDYEMTSAGMEEIKSQIKEFEDNLRRILINQGVSYEALEQQIADPSAHVDVQMMMISAVTEIPKRILTGSERGELSSAQDKQEYISFVTARREEKNEPMILRPFIDRCIELGVLPTPKDGKYIVVWDKLFSLSDEKKVEMGKMRAVALKEYSISTVAQELMPFDLFCEMFLNMDSTQVDRVIEANGGKVKAEIDLTDEEKYLLKKSGDDVKGEPKKIPDKAE